MNEPRHTLPGDEQADAGFRAFIAEVEEILRTLPGRAGDGAGGRVGAGAGDNAGNGAGMGARTGGGISAGAGAGDSNGNGNGAGAGAGAGAGNGDGDGDGDGNGNGNGSGSGHGHAQGNGDVAGPGASGAEHEAAGQAHRRLRTLIDMQDLLAGQGLARTTAIQPDPHRYLKAALADELLLGRPWIGQSAWPRHLLETALFGTSVAGDKLLADMALLLQSREPGQRPLARQYLFALALGFQGRLRGQDDLRPLGALRLQLYQFVYQRQPAAETGQAVLSPQAYAHTLSQLAPKRRPAFSRWTLRWTVSLVALLVLSQAVWFWQTWPLRQALTGTGSGLPAAGSGVAP